MSLLDSDERLRAATDFETNLVVEAGAGTGKTSLLVERLLNLVLSGHTPLSGIVAITFTEKAAVEMKDRVALALEALLRPGETPGSTEAARTKAWLLENGVDPATRAREALDELERASISTIHAFCSDLLRRYPVESGLPPDFEVGTRVEQADAFEEAWSGFVASELGPGATRAATWRRALSAFGFEEIEAVARGIVLAPAACDALEREGYRPLDPASVRVPRAVDLEAALLREAEAVRNPTCRGLLRTLASLTGAFARGGLPAFRAMSEHVTDAKLWTRDDPYTAGQGTREDVEEAVKRDGTDALRFVRNLRLADEPPFLALMELLRPFFAEIRRRTRERGLCSFDDLLLLARNLLRDHPSVLSREADRIRTILVDEFQDTDPLQYEIVLMLAGGGRAREEEGQLGLFASSPAQSILPGGRLFIVGDPKQSIYRFRGADMAAFSRTVRRVLEEGGARVALRTNFRSDAPILHAVNALFEGWMGSDADRDVEPEYIPVAAFRSGGEGPQVEFLTALTAPGAKAEEARQAEARVLPEAIERVRRDLGIRYRDVAVLHRAMTQVGVYTRSLREARIPFVVDGGKAFAERHEIVEAVALLTALANPADPVATLAVLRSSAGGVTDAEIFRFAAGGGKFLWAREDPEREARSEEVGRVYRWLRGIAAETRTLPLDRTIHRLLTEGLVPILAAATFEGAQRAANVRKLANRAAALARSRGLSLLQVIRALEDEFLAENVEGESPLADERLDAVRVVSIHRAKGLEFEAVFLPDLPRQEPPPPPEIRMKVLRTATGDFVALRTRGRMNAAWAVAVDEDRRHERAELKRVLYVAMTRARRRLVVVNGESKSNGEWLRTIASQWRYEGSADASAGETLAGGLVLHRVAKPSALSAGSDAPADPGIRAAWNAFGEAREKAGAMVHAPYRTPSESKMQHADSDPDARERARTAGDLMHRVLEQWDNHRPADIPGILEAILRREPAEEASAGDARGIAAGFAGTALAARLAGVEVLARELPVLFRDAEGRTVYGYADLVYRLEGRIHVADYKTDRSSPEEASAAHASQLRDYAEAVRRTLGLLEMPIMELILLRTGERIEVA